MDAPLTTAAKTSCCPRWPWALALTCAFLAFTVRIGHEPLWIDETYSLAMVQHGGELTLAEPMSWVKLNVRRFRRAAAGPSAEQ